MEAPTSSKKLLLSARFRPVWPSSLHLPLLGVPTEVGKVARAWLLISLGEIFLLLGPVDVK